MTTVDISNLNQQFGITGQLCFAAAQNGLVVAEISNAYSSAKLALQGAQVIDWTPRGADPVIWLSRAASFSEGKSIRGGVPICWPWFGPHASETGFPAHGYARIVPWTVVDSGELENGATYIALRLLPTPAARLYWNHDTPAEVRLTVGKTLEIELLTRNLGTEPVVISQALHAYFRVGDVREIVIRGFDGCPYIERAAGVAESLHQDGPVTISGEVDRVYQKSKIDSLIEDPKLNRRIRISKQGSTSSVVWNPWIEKSAKIGDMGDAGYLSMVCVETANIAPDQISLAPGEEHRLWTSYSVET